MLEVEKRCPYCGGWIRLEYREMCQRYAQQFLRAPPVWWRECAHCHQRVCAPFFWEAMTMLVSTALGFVGVIAVVPSTAHPTGWVITALAVTGATVAYLTTGLFRRWALEYVELVRAWGLFGSAGTWRKQPGRRGVR